MFGRYDLAERLKSTISLSTAGRSDGDGSLMKNSLPQNSRQKTKRTTGLGRNRLILMIGFLSGIVSPVCGQGERLGLTLAQVVDTEGEMQNRQSVGDDLEAV